MPTTSLATLVDTWLAAYCQSDGALRTEAVRSVWNLQGHLADPPFEARGVQAIADAGGTLLSHYPGHRFERTTAIDEHHGVARYGWRLLDTQGAAVLEGLDVLTLDVDGRIASVVGFFGAQPGL